MSSIALLLVAVGLAMDAFAVAIATSAQENGRRMRTAVAMIVLFGGFQGGMALLGWSIGHGVERWVSAVDHWIAFALLAVVGLKMVRDGRNPEAAPRIDVAHPATLLVLAVATSIDALAVGMGLAFLDIDPLRAALDIAGVTALLTAVGAFAGRTLGRAFGERMQIAGGVVLLVIGAKILVTHLTA